MNNKIYTITLTDKDLNILSKFFTKDGIIGDPDMDEVHVMDKTYDKVYADLRSKRGFYEANQEANKAAISKRLLKPKWLEMKDAPKDGTRILIKSNDGNVYVAAWLNNYDPPGEGVRMEWAIPESWQDEQGGYFTVDYPVGWMPCPYEIEE
jgi:hypothetical protein